MDNPEIHATLGTQDTGRRQKKPQKNQNTENWTDEQQGPHQNNWGEPRCLWRVSISCFVYTCHVTHIKFGKSLVSDRGMKKVLCKKEKIQCHLWNGYFLIKP